MEKEFTLIPDGKYEVEMDYTHIGRKGANLRFQIIEGERKGEFLFITIHAINYLTTIKNICSVTGQDQENIPENEISADYLSTFYNIPLVVESAIRDIPMSGQCNAITGFFKSENTKSKLLFDLNDHKFFDESIDELEIFDNDIRITTANVYGCSRLNKEDVEALAKHFKII